MSQTFQCPTCGRIREDWANPETKHLAVSLSKGRQRQDNEDRTIAYREWRRQLGASFYVTDLDHVEWRIRDGVPKAVAVFELSRVDGNIALPDSYLKAVLDRYNKRDGQGVIVKTLAEELKVSAWIILFRHDLSEFWVLNLSHPEQGWFKRVSPENLSKWIRKL